MRSTVSFNSMCISSHLTCAQKMDFNWTESPILNRRLPRCILHLSLLLLLLPPDVSMFLLLRPLAGEGYHQGRATIRHNAHQRAVDSAQRPIASRGRRETSERLAETPLLAGGVGDGDSLLSETSPPSLHSLSPLTFSPVLLPPSSPCVVGRANVRTSSRLLYR